MGTKLLRFDVIIGNPPYQQMDDGHGASAIPLYNLFIEQAKRMKPKYLTMIIPSRWFSGGKGLSKFRKSMLNDGGIREIHDFPIPSEIFPSVDVKGGINYFLWDKDYKGSNEVVQRIAKEYGGHKEFAAKSLIVMAKNFAGLKDSYQASYILESVVKNFKEYPAVVAEAKKELTAVKAEAAKSNSSVK